MTLSNPIAFAFTAIIPIIIAFYLLKLRRKKLIVSSTFFWTEMVQDLQANVPFQKLRWNILLFLQLLIAVAIIAAMLDLNVKAALNEGQRTIIIIDTSASMQTRLDGGTRFSKAISDLRAYCSNLSHREQVLIIEAGEYAKLQLDFTSNLPAIQRALDSLKPRDAGSDLATAYEFARSRAREVDKPMIVVVSDFSGINEDLFSNPEYPLSFHDLSSSAENLAILDFNITGESRDDTGGNVNAFMIFRNFTATARTCPVEFYLDGKLVDVRSVTLDSGSKEGKLFRGIPYNPDSKSNGVLEAKLDINDDFQLDNIAYAIPPLTEGMTVLVVGENQFLINALSGVPGIRLFQIAQSQYIPGAGYDLTFFTGYAPNSLSPGSYVFFNPPNRDYLPCSVGEQVEYPRVTDWNDRHPMLRFVNPGSFNVFAAQKLTPKPGSLTLIDGNNTPLMVYGERGNLRTLVFPFSLNNSDLITRPTFPILIFNLVSFFRSHVRSGSGNLRTQGITSVWVDSDAETLKLIGDDGIELTFPVDAGHAFIDVDKVGIYTMKIDDGDDSDRILVANLFDEKESDVAARTSFSTTAGIGEIRRFDVQGEKRIWKWLAIVALLILTGEWYFYHRKGFGNIPKLLTG
ncbi:MAG TPA: VWA domain-containing protein [Firmicutes bacterium]|nr:VWA domain-containing protein [Bacillota bacterium]